MCRFLLFVVCFSFSVYSQAFCQETGVLNAAKPACAQLDSTKYGDDNPLPAYSAGTLILGPYLVGLTAEDVSFRWEVMGETNGQIRIVGPDISDSIKGIPMPVAEALKDLPGIVHEATVSALQPCTEYRYRLEPYEHDGFPHRFKTAPPPGERCSRNTRFVVYGDSRTHHKVHGSLMPALISAGADYAINVGDLVFKPRRIFEWQKFFQIEAGFLASTPISVTPGNHEGHNDPEFGKAMFGRYFLDGLNNGVGHYSFLRGNVFFVMLDLYFGAPIGDPETVKWLDSELSKAPEGSYTFVILHDPVVTFSRHPPRQSLRRLTGLFEKHKVTAVCAGHAHVYEHFFMKGVHYLTLGGMGAEFHQPRSRVSSRYEKYFKSSKAFYHFLRVTVEPDRVRFEVIDAKDASVYEEWVAKEDKVESK